MGFNVKSLYGGNAGKTNNTTTRQSGFNVKSLRDQVFEIKLSDNKTISNISYGAKKAIENNTLDSYTPKNDAEKKSLETYKKWTGYGKTYDTVKSQYDKDKFGKGNIDLTNRPIYKNEDNTISTVDSITVGIDDKQFLLPTIVKDEKGNAKRLKTTDEAVEHYRKTGQYLGKFDTQEEADEYAQSLHIDQDLYYSAMPEVTSEEQEVFDKYGLNPITFDDDDFAKWAESHNFEHRIAGGLTSEYKWLPKYDKKSFSLINKNLTTKEEADKEVLERFVVKKNEQANAKEHPVLTSAITVATAPYRGLAGAVATTKDTVSSALGKEINTNDKAHNIVEDANIIRETVTEEHASNWFGGASGKLGNYGALAYNGLMSIGDAVMTSLTMRGIGSGLGLTGKGLASFTSNATSGLLASTSGASTIMEKKKEGLSDGQAVANGLATAASEFITEKISLDLIFKKPSSMLKKGFIGFLAEGTEEMASDVLSKTADYVISGDDSTIKNNINQYMQNGMSKDNAVKQATWDSIFETLSAGLVGGLSGVAMSSAYHGFGKSEIKRLGADYRDVAADIIQSGLDSPENTTAYKHAEKLQKKGISNISDYELGLQHTYNVEQIDYEQEQEEKRIKKGIKKAAKIGRIAYPSAEDVSVGNTFKDTKTGHTITVTERNDKNTVVQIDTGEKTETKVFTNSQIDSSVESGQLEEFYNAESEVDELMNTDMSEAVETSAGTIAPQTEMSGVKVGDVYVADDKTYTIVSRDNGRTTYTITDENGNTITRETSNVVADINFTKGLYTKAQDGANAINTNIASATPKNITLTRIGDFYEAYGDEAVELANKLNLTVTPKTINGEKVQMVGFPVHALENYSNALGSNYNLTVADTPTVTSINDENMHVTTETETVTSANTENAPATDKSHTVAYTNDNVKIDLKFKVVSADDLIVSNELDGKVNPDYPQELQPRDRDRVSSQNQIRQMANNLNPARLAESTSVSEGAPIVGPDNVVESGNGRTLAIKLAYEIGTADEYRNYIISNAGEYGADISNLPEKPMLVRERLTEVDRVEFTRKANESSIGSLSATEQAKVDAEKLTNDVLGLLIANDDGIINTKENENFISAVVTRVFKSEDLNNVVRADGKLSTRGLERITNAIFYKAYGDASLSARLSESLDNDMKNATKVLLNIAPKVVSIKNDIAAGVLYDFDFSADIVNAVKLFESCRNDNMTIEDYALQTSLFEKETQLVKAMAYVFETKNRGAKQATDFYNILLDTVEESGNPKQMSFDIIETYQTKEEIFDDTVEKFNAGVESKNTVTIPESLYRPESEEGRENDGRGIDEISRNESNENAKVEDAVRVQQDNGPGEEAGVNAEDEQLRQKNESVVGKSEVSEINKTDTENVEEVTVEATAETTVSKGEASKQIADYVAAKLAKGEKLSAMELSQIASKAFGGTMANNAFSIKDAYDAMELGVNQHILSMKDVSAEKMLEILELLPTQTKRTEEQVKFQQFSTPPSIAYLANYTANVNANDIMLEPSAGIGGIAVFAKKDGAKVYVNELDNRRLEVLKNMPFDGFFNENAEQLDNILGGEIEPTVIVMNPPFSSSSERNMKNTKIGAKHIEQALKILAPNGRLVAIVGNGMADGAPAFRTWWKDIKSQYNVRANIGVNGKNYNKYGTSFDIQILVIDKNGPTTQTETGYVDTLQELQEKLGGIRDERPTIDYSANEQRISATTRQETATTGKRGSNGNGTISDTGSRTNKGKSTDKSGTSEKSTAKDIQSTTADSRRTDNQTPEIANGVVDGQPPDGRGELRGNAEMQDDGRTDIFDSKQHSEQSEVDRSDGDVGTRQNNVRVQRHNRTKLTDSIFEQYQPQPLKVKNAQPHPAKVSESAAMSAIEPPVITYKPNIPQDIIDKGVVSDVQLEAISYAGQSHSQTLPNGTTRGFFLGDGTGIGKGRTIAGMMLDNYNQGRKKAVWVTLNSSLVNDAKRDVKALFGNSDLVTQFVGGNKADSVLNTDEAIMVISYSTLSKGFDNKDSNFEKLVKWLGKDFDGLIVFDEAHKMGNATSVKGTRGVKKASQTGIAGIALQEALPKAKIVYSSATGATEVENLRYAERLGLWGEGTPFVKGDDFVSKVKAGGLAAMELIARDMKAMGVYLSRNISYDDVQYGRITHKLTSLQTKIYDELARSWQIVLQNINKALESTNQDKDGHARGRALGAFWSAQQRFFNQILTSMQVPSVISDIEKQLADGKSCVIQLVSTNEAAQNQEFERLKSEDLELDEFDLTPKQVLMSLIENSFPVQQFDEYRDDNGNVRSKPVYDSKGNPVINREAVKQRDELLTKLGSIKVPSSPIDMIINHFGTDMVAENTGRARRVIQKDGKTIEEKIGNKKDADVDAFQNGNKRILIFSKAGGTGKSYHADKSAKNQQQRVLYVLEAGWQADNAVQGFGRVHRSNQASAPIIKLVTTNLKGQMRFISTIAKRLDQLGAMTKGQRQAGGQGIFSASDNLENGFAADVLAGFYKDLVLNRVDGIDDGLAILEKLGLKNKILNEYNQILPTASELREVNKFLNRILSLESSEQNTVFEGYSQRLQDATEKAMQAGTLDKGLENYKADKITLNEVQDIREDERSGAKTKYYNLTAEHKIKPIKFEDIPTDSESFVGYYKNKNTGSVRAVMHTSSSTDQYGNVTQNYKLIGQIKPEYIPQHRLYGNWVEIKADEARKAWNEELSKLPEYRKENLHLISGVVLPVWDKLPTENVRIYRVLTSDGEMLIGRVVSEDMIDETLRRLGSSRKREKIATKDLISSIKNGDKVHLENDWILVSRKVSGEDRIELMGPSYEHHDMLMEKGVFAERIQYRTRYFIPADTNTEKIIDDILKLSPVMRVENVKYSIESEEFNDEQAGSDLLSGNGNRGSNASAGKQAKRISDFKQKIKGKTKAERRSFAKELLAEGQIEEITDGKRQFNIVKTEAYNDDMLSIVEEAKEMGLDVGFFVGHGKFRLSDLKIDALKQGNKILLRYDGFFSPQTLFRHELTHNEWNNPEMQKARDIIINDLSETEKKKILSEERYKNYMALYKDKENKEELVWEEFVADVFAGMNDYTSDYIDLVVDYWYEGKVIDRYNPAEYINSTDTGGNDAVLDNVGFGDEYSLSDYSEKALPIGSMKNDFHKDLTPSEWVNYYEVVNRFDWDSEMRSQEFAFVVKLNGKTILSTYERGKPQVYYITKENTNFEEGALYDRAEAERIFGLIRENEIQRNETSGDGIVTVGEESDGDAPKLTDNSQKDGDRFGIYDGSEKVLYTGISEDINDDIKYSLSIIDDDITELTPERKKEIFEQWEKDHAGVDKPTQKQLWGERVEWIAHNMTRVFPDIPERGEKGTFFAEFRKMMIQWKALPQTSMFMTQDKLNQMTKDLTPAEFKTFSELVYFLDLQEESQIQKERGYEEILLPNEITPHEVDQIVDALNKEATDNVKNALAKRQHIWNDLKEQYITLNQYIGFDTDGRFNRKNYYHHQVIEYMNQGGKGVAKGKDIEIKAGRGWLKERQGSTKATNTDFLAVEYKAMLQMQYDIYVANMLGKIKDQYDIKPQLEKQAFNHNKELLKQKIAEEATDENGNIMLDNKGKPDSETYRQQQWYNQRIMFGFSGLFDLAEANMLPTFNGQYGNVIRALERHNLNAPGLYNYVGELASMELPDTVTDEELQAQISARTVLKYTSQKKAWVKSILADDYQTWETLANDMKDTHSIHQPRRGNYFYTKTTIDEDAFNKAFNDMIIGLVAGENGVDTTADMKKLFAQYSETVRLMGAAYEQWVIPNEIETTMNKVANPKQASVVSQLSRSILSSWKGWSTSVNPFRTVKFGIRNIFGDLDAVIAGNPKVVVYSKQAVKEIFQAMKNKKYTPEFMEWVERGGYSSLIFANEMDTEMQDKLFSHLKDKEGLNIFKIPAKLFEGYYNGVEAAHNFREAILRYSAYLYFKNDIIKNGGKVRDNVASNRYIIQGLQSVEDKAYQLSKDLLGAYDEVGAMGQALRRHLIPFYSFTETNLKRYYRLFENIIMSDDNIPKKAVKLLLKGLMVNMLTLLMVAWNRLVMKDEDDELPPSVRNIPHITLGKIGDEVYAFRQVGSFSELLEWVGFEDYQWTEEDKTAALDKAVGMITPIVKTPIELLTGLNFYPSITQPRAIRDKVEHFFSTLGLDDVYRVAVGKPTKGISDIVKGAVTYSYDYKESAYYEILDIKREYQGDTDNTIYGQTPRSNALYYMKTAIRYKDKEAALKYLDEYFENGGTAKGITQSIAMLNPMYGYTSEDSIEKGQEFVNSLSDDEKDKLKIAINYYENDLMLPEHVSAMLRKKGITDRQAKNLLTNYITSKCK